MGTPLQDRLDDLPLILAGPLLRRTEPDSVTVWVALKEPRTVTLRVYTWSAGQTQKMVGTASTVRIGEHLHLVAVTAEALASDHLLAWGEQYVYNLFFARESVAAGQHLPEAATNLHTAQILNKNPNTATQLQNLIYPGNTLPSFAMSPPDLTSFRLIHASCRKLHGEGDDALVALDQMIESTASNPSKRPHLLFLTGDQIYADDVADVLLAALDDAGRTLLGWEEQLPQVTSSAQLRPGYRALLAEKTAGLTAGLGKPEVAKSHLMRFADFCTMYLAAWSDVIWPAQSTKDGKQVTDWQTFRDLYPDKLEETYVVLDSAMTHRVPTKAKEQFTKEVNALERFRSTLPQIRRALANTPTYMIFDDHEITDDWYINLEWCRRVLQPALGRRIIQNGLAAYALFQGWGNTPVQFQNIQPGQHLLTAIDKWSIAKGNSEPLAQEIGKLVGLPQWEDVKANKRLSKVAGSLDWHYQVHGPHYEVLVLDSRTWREYPGGNWGSPLLIGRKGLDEQLLKPKHTNAAVTIIASPAPVLGVPLVELYQSIKIRDTQPFHDDVEAWGLQSLGFELLIGRFAIRVAAGGQNGPQVHRQRVVLLSGDVHYGFSARMQYWADQPFEAGQTQKVEMVIAQLTASSLKNQATLTKVLHTNGYNVTKDRLPTAIERVAWNNSQQQRLDVGTFKVDHSFLKLLGADTATWRVSGYPAIEDLKSVRHISTEYKLTLAPDWLYRQDYLLAENDVERPGATGPRIVPAPPAGNRKQALAVYLAMARNHSDYLGKWGDGKEIVGVNNLGEVTFRWNGGDDWSAVHELWWRLQGRGQLLTPFPLTRYLVSLNFNHPSYPRPALEQKEL